ncbi:MFS transporter (plasmid) [Pseudonocardia sp. EC080610-09]|uniref:MFS transporter n=1 Tax=unclassified Pseudonocardia TaxID=2619320 RepID=UPI000706C08C|nr:MULTISPECIES: MFS transporter [unclassified Pseudonocardia]ALL79277.1 MFS transporter [Pseudonocardia sp. EC080610-09]ALL85247.1 MFS transporter [Pseudonocardia sp. EC080619-01]
MAETVSDHGDQVRARRRQSPARIMLAGASGNFVEWFDFTLYGFSAVVIAATFFPADSGSSGLLATFAIYGVAFVARPAGAVVFGRIGDRMGRRTALSASVLLMGAATAAIGLLPSWSAIGIAAPILLMVCRLAQGFSAGGEYTGALTFGLEHAPPRRRMLWMSVVGSSTMLGVTGATLTIVVFQAVAGDAFAAGAWRWTFVFGGLLSLVGLLLRLGVDETPVFTELTADRGSRGPGLGRMLRERWRMMLVLLCFYGVLGVVTHMFLGYMPTYLSQVGGISSSTALTIITGLTLFAAFLGPVFGSVADRIGRRPLVRTGALGAVVVLVPAYLLIGTGSLPAIVVAMLGLLVVVSLLGAGGMAVLEMLPADVRYTGMALPYNVAYAAFAGTAPLVSQALVDASGSLLAPAYYASALALIALPVIFRSIPETRGSDLRTGALTS